MVYCAIGLQTLPRQQLDSLGYRDELAALRSAQDDIPAWSQTLTCGHQVVLDQAEDALGKDGRADVGISGGSGAQVECAVGEAVLRHMCVSGGENGALVGVETRRRRWVVVGVVFAWDGHCSWASACCGPCRRSCETDSRACGEQGP